MGSAGHENGQFITFLRIFLFIFTEDPAYFEKSEIAVLARHIAFDRCKHSGKQGRTQNREVQTDRIADGKQVVFPENKISESRLLINETGVDTLAEPRGNELIAKLLHRCIGVGTERDGSFGIDRNLRELVKSVDAGDFFGKIGGFPDIRAECGNRYKAGVIRDIGDAKPESSENFDHALVRDFHSEQACNL